MERFIRMVGSEFETRLSGIFVWRKRHVSNTVTLHSRRHRRHFVPVNRFRERRSRYFNICTVINRETQQQNVLTFDARIIVMVRFLILNNKHAITNSFCEIRTIPEEWQPTNRRANPQKFVVIDGLDESGRTFFGALFIFVSGKRPTGFDRTKRFRARERYQADVWMVTRANRFRRTNNALFSSVWNRCDPSYANRIRSTRFFDVHNSKEKLSYNK